MVAVFLRAPCLFYIIQCFNSFQCHPGKLQVAPIKRRGRFSVEEVGLSENMLTNRRVSHLFQVFFKPIQPSLHVGKTERSKNVTPALTPLLMFGGRGQITESHWNNSVPCDQRQIRANSCDSTEHINDVNGPNCAVAMGYIRQLHKSVFSYPYKGLLKKSKRSWSKHQSVIFKTPNTNISLKTMEV